MFVKEVVYKCRNPVGLTNAARMIKEMQKEHKTRETEAREARTFVEQEALVMCKGPPVAKISDLFSRPTLGLFFFEATFCPSGFTYISR